MLDKIILRAIMTILIVFSSANIAIAQLKNASTSNQVSIDWSVLDEFKTKPSISRIISKENTYGDLLKPPSKMPRSRYLRDPSKTKPVKKLPRIKLKPIKKLKKNSFKRTNTSKKVKILKPRNKNATKLNFNKKTSPRKNTKKLSSNSRQSRKKPTNLTSNVALHAAKRTLAPVPKALPKAPVNTLKAPPPEPMIKKEPVNIVPNSTQLAARKTNIDQRAKPLIFKQGDSKLSAKAKKTLDTMSVTLKLKPNSRMQLQAYAGEPNISASRARRLSLSRALSVRSYLIKKGIRSTRIDVRALGNKTSAGEPNRVDLKLIKN